MYRHKVRDPQGRVVGRIFAGHHLGLVHVSPSDITPTNHLRLSSWFLQVARLRGSRHILCLFEDGRTPLKFSLNTVLLRGQRLGEDTYIDLRHGIVPREVLLVT